ncbi:MAG: hypothetical protein QM820_56715 [Minicystis sp.]
MSAVDAPRFPSHSSRPPPARRDPAPSPLEAARAVRINEDGFVAETTLDGWVRSGAAARAGAAIKLADGRGYVLRDAVRVIGRRNGDTDPYGFTGRVEALRELIRRGATLSADALRLGPAVYDVEYGFIVTPDA